MPFVLNKKREVSKTSRKNLGSDLTPDPQSAVPSPYSRPSASRPGKCLPSGIRQQEPKQPPPPPRPPPPQDPANTAKVNLGFDCMAAGVFAKHHVVAGFANRCRVHDLIGLAAFEDAVLMNPGLTRGRRRLHRQLLCWPESAYR